MRSMTATVPIVDGLSTSRICKSIISSRNVHGTPKTQGRTIFPTLCRHAECATTTSGQILWKRSGAISRKFPESSGENYIYKVGVAYGNVVEHEKPITFYFEQMEGKKDGNETSM